MRAQRVEQRLRHLHLQRHRVGIGQHVALARVEQRRALPVAHRVHLGLRQALGQRHRRVLAEFVGRAVKYRHAQDDQFAQRAIEQRLAADRAHQAVPAPRQRRAVQQLAVQVEQRAAAPLPDAAQQFAVDVGRVFVNEVESGHDMKRYTTKPRRKDARRTCRHHEHTFPCRAPPKEMFMKTWIKRTLIGLFGATILVGGLAACGQRHHGGAARRSAPKTRPSGASA